MTANANLWAFQMWLDTELSFVGVTQADLARHLGVANYVVYNWLKRRRPGAANCARLAWALGASVNFVRGLVGRPAIEGGDVVPEAPRIIAWMEQQRTPELMGHFCRDCHARIEDDEQRCPDCVWRLQLSSRQQTALAWMELSGICYDLTGAPHV